MLLLDTCSLLWLVGEQGRFRAGARAEMDRHAGQLFVSAISAFEVGVKLRRGGLRLPLPLPAWWCEVLSFHELREVSVSGAIAARATQLPAIHADPCDRILIATALSRGWRLVTPDQKIAGYPGLSVLW